jgi:hypothetical protein
MLGSFNKIILSLFVSAMLSAMALPQIQTPGPLDGSGWHIEVVDHGVRHGFVPLALYSNGYPGISYLEDEIYDLRYARWTGVSWSRERIDAIEQIGAPRSVVIDSNDTPHIGYFNPRPWTRPTWPVQRLPLPLTAATTLTSAMFMDKRNSNTRSGTEAPGYFISWIR